MVGLVEVSRLSSDRGSASGVRQDFPDVGPSFRQTTKPSKKPFKPETLSRGYSAFSCVVQSMTVIPRDGDSQEKSSRPGDDHHPLHCGLTLEGPCQHRRRSR